MENDFLSELSLGKVKLELIRRIFAEKIKLINSRLKSLEALEAQRKEYAEILAIIDKLIESG